MVADHGLVVEGKADKELLDEVARTRRPLSMMLALL